MGKSGRKGGGASLGNALKNAGRNVTTGRRTGVQHKHTTEFEGEEKPNLQSVIERNDLDELMAMADLAGRDFTAERRDVVVISGHISDPADDARRVAEALEAAKEHAGRMKVPRRPEWDAEMSTEELDQNERTSFLEWRRELALVEEDGRVSVTPFEKNLEVWRQLWRVLERSDMVVQVVDARDPIMYRCEDLEKYAMELGVTKQTVLLLNKSDLLSAEMRALWADYFDSVGARYLFWSAKQVTDDDLDGVEEVEEEEEEDADPRIRVYRRDNLLVKLEDMALACVLSGGAPDPREEEPPRRLMVGLVGYPNVGKSSTINALRGEKKTMVSSTPGKTKHFQTLIVADGLMLCDCPGLVFPSIGSGTRAEMVAAAVLPIDRLTDIRSPLEVVTSRIPRAELEATYNITLPLPTGPGEDAHRNPSAAELLRAYAIVRGYALKSGVPDEMKAGREIMRDYVGGKLLYCRVPETAVAKGYPTGVSRSTMPGADGELVEDVRSREERAAVRRAAAESGENLKPGKGGKAGGVQGGVGVAAAGVNDGGMLASMFTHTSLSGGGVVTGKVLGGAPGGGAGGGRPQSAQKDGARAGHKFQKKPKREKGRRGMAQDEGGVGGAMIMGKRGGINRFATDS